jgi:hypothetical protein
MDSKTLPRMNTDKRGSGKVGGGTVRSLSKRKVPHPYSRAEEGARAVTGIRDDESLSGAEFF